MLVTLGGLGAGAALAGRRVMRDGAGGRPDRWHAVTVNRAFEELAGPGGLPALLADLGEKVEIQMRPAPGDRGTEVFARWREPLPAGPAEVAARARDDDPRQVVRKALREAKSVLETGEVVLPDRPPTNEPTLTERPLGSANRRARGEGLP